MMEHLRNAARKKAKELQHKPSLNRTPHSIILNNSGTAVWDIHKNEQTLLVATEPSGTVSAFKKVITHAQKNNVEFACIDLRHSFLLQNMDNDWHERTALTVEEANLLCQHLLEELRERVMKEIWEQELLILIKDGHKLFTINDVEKADQYMELLTNLQAVIAAGALFGIKIFMEVDAETAAKETHKDFKNTIVLT